MPTMSMTDATEPYDAPESQVAMLHRISSIVSSNLSLDEMLGEVIGLAVQATACDACLVYLIDPANEEVVLRASQVPHAADLGTLRMKVGEGVTGWVAEHKSVVALASNAASDPRFKYFQGLIEDTYEAFLSVPLISGGASIGVINVHHREIHQHTGGEITMLVFIGEQLGGAISKSILEESERGCSKRPSKCGASSRPESWWNGQKVFCSRNLASPRKRRTCACATRADAFADR